MSDKTKDLVNTIAAAFEELQSSCEHADKNGPDCRHPDQDFNCMNCQISICPLLGDL